MLEAEFETVADLELAVNKAGITCDFNGPRAPEQPGLIGAKHCTSSIVLRLYDTTEVARVDGELIAAKSWELMERIEKGSAEPRMWVTGGNWVILCGDLGECGQLQEAMGGSIETYDGPGT